MSLPTKNVIVNLSTYLLMNIEFFVGKSIDKLTANLSTDQICQ